MEAEPTLQFRLDRKSGVPAYRQVVDQVRQALRLGILRPGDQLPTVRDVVKQIAINPNTVHRAYRDLEAQGLTEGRPRQWDIHPAHPLEGARRAAPASATTREVDRAARAAGLGDEAIAALVAEATESSKKEEA